MNELWLKVFVQVARIGKWLKLLTEVNSIIVRFLKSIVILRESFCVMVNTKKNEYGTRNKSIGL